MLGHTILFISFASHWNYLFCRGSSQCLLHSAKITEKSYTIFLGDLILFAQNVCLLVCAYRMTWLVLFSIFSNWVYDLAVFFLSLALLPFSSNANTIINSQTETTHLNLWPNYIRPNVLIFALFSLYVHFSSLFFIWKYEMTTHRWFG